MPEVDGPIDGEGKINPSMFPVPKTLTNTLLFRAHRLRTGGSNMALTGEDITTSWGGLSNCYTAPEAEELFTVMDPVASSGIVIEMATDRVANALEDFAETVADIQRRWESLKTEAREFLSSIEDEGDDWNKGDWFGFGSSSNQERNNELLGQAAALVEEFAEAESTCANKINIGIDGRTEFISEEEVSGSGPDANQFVHGTGADVPEIPSDWGEPAATDHNWLRDVGDAVWDFGVGAAEGVGGMVGAHSSEGWFAQSWGDSFTEYHWDNLTSAASLVGMYDAESDSLGWNGGEGVGEAWKDLAHAVVPWEEWGERPGYVIGTAVLNIGVTAVGAALTATGVGAAVGVPLMAWRGMAILDGMGGSGSRGSNGDSGADLPSNLPDYGGNGSPVANLDTSSFSPAQLANVQASLDRLPGNQSSSNESSSGGRPGQSRSNQTDPTSEDLVRADRAIAPESSSRGDNSSGSGKKSEDKNPGNWEGGAGESKPNNRGSEGSNDRVPVGPNGAGGDSNTRTASTSSRATGAATLLANNTSIDGGGPGNSGPGNEIADTNRTGDQGATTQDQSPTANNQDGDNPSPTSDNSGNNSSENGKNPGSTPVENAPGNSQVFDSSQGGRSRNELVGTSPAIGSDAPSRSPESQGISDSQLEKKIEKSKKCEEALENGGWSKEEIDKFRGDYARDSYEWQRVADAVNQNYGGKVVDVMLPKTMKFAREGSSSLVEFAYRFEYYKATFDELVAIEKNNGMGRGPAQDKIAHKMDQIPVQGRLNSDIEIVREKRSNQDVRIDRGLSDMDLNQSLRERAGDIGMGDDTSASYHARKHYDEILPSERNGNHVENYLDSLEKTMREGEISSRTPLDDGGERVMVRRPVLDENGNVQSKTDKKGITRENYLRAVVILKGDGAVVVPTYGAARVVVGG